MSRRTTVRVAAVVLLVAVAAWVVPGTASAQGGPDVEVAPEPTATPSTLPVEDLTLPVEELILPVESLDGAVVDNGDDTFRLASDVLFEFDKSDLTQRARDELAEVAKKLQAAIDDGKQPPVRVVGHTDDVGENAYNQRLSQERAESVRAALTAALPGVEVVASGKGETEPFVANDTDRNRAQNRRVEISVG